MADGIAITKSEADNLKKARQAQTDLQHALHLFQSPDSGVPTKVLLTSSLANTGIQEVWATIETFMEHTKTNGFLQRNRQQQNLKWFHESIGQLLQEQIRSSKTVHEKMTALEDQIKQQKILPVTAARELITTFFSA